MYFIFFGLFAVDSTGSAKQTRNELFFLNMQRKYSFFLFLNARRNNSKTEKHAVESNLGPGTLATTPNNYD